MNKIDVLVALRRGIKGCVKLSWTQPLCKKVSNIDNVKNVNTKHIFKMGKKKWHVIIASIFFAIFVEIIGQTGVEEIIYVGLMRKWNNYKNNGIKDSQNVVNVVISLVKTARIASIVAKMAVELENIVAMALLAAIAARAFLISANVVFYVSFAM